MKRSRSYCDLVSLSKTGSAASRRKYNVGKNVCAMPQRQPCIFHRNTPAQNEAKDHLPIPYIVHLPASVEIRAPGVVSPPSRGNTPFHDTHMQKNTPAQRCFPDLELNLGDAYVEEDEDDRKRSFVGREVKNGVDANNVSLRTIVVDLQSAG